MAASLTKYLIWILSPLGLWIFLTALACLGFLGRRRLKLWVIVLASMQLFLCSLPVVSDWLFGHLEKEAMALQVQHPVSGKLDAIVVLGGGLEPAYEGVRALPDLGDGADRMWTAANLYRAGLAPIVLVSGGGFNVDPRKHTEAEGMRDFLIALGVPAERIVLEDRSRTTLENAFDSMRVLEGVLHRQVEARTPLKIALVTSGFHMGRSYVLFKKAGFEVYPVCSDLRITGEKRPLWEWLPRSQALDRSSLAIKEYLGRLQQWVLGLYLGRSSDSSA